MTTSVNNPIIKASKDAKKAKQRKLKEALKKEELKTILKRIDEFNKKIISKMYEKPISLHNKEKTHAASEARQLVYLLLRNEGYTLKQIGDAFELTHTPILHGVNRIELKIKTDKDYRKRLSIIVKLLNKKSKE